MKQKLNGYFYKIGILVELYLIITVCVFLFGPIKWIDEWNIYNVVGVFFIITYVVAFFIGFMSKKRKNMDILFSNSISVREKNKKLILKLLRYFLWIALFIVVWNALEYSSSTSLSNLLNNAINGLTNPAEVYYMKDTSSRAGSIITYINLFFQPIVYITFVMGLYYFKSLKFYQKSLYIIMVLVEVMRWLSVGTNKGLLDVIFIFVSVYVLKVARKDDNKMSKVKKIIMFSVIIFFIFLFLNFFGNAMSDRVGGYYDNNNFVDFPYNMIPEESRVLVEKIDSYLTQGYNNMLKCIENCEFKWTYGIGNSRFLISVVERLLGVDIFSRTYPAQLEAFGVDPLVSWHSAYAWFASDIGFFGIILLMLLVGRYFASVLQDAVVFQDPLSITIFYFLLLAIVNSPCTNYVLAYVNMWSGIVILSLIRWKRKKRIKICIGNIKI